MTTVQAAILGLVQGVTEFLPVSSSGHLVLVQQFMGLKDRSVVSFDVLLHLGTLAAVMAVFGADLWALLKRPWQRLTVLLLASFVPTAIIALALKDWIEELFASGKTLGIEFIISGLVLWLAIRVKAGRKGLDRMTVGDGAVIGVLQGVAILPAVSRSGMTIAGALFRGLDRETAARYSFLASIPVIAAAAAFDLLKLIKAHEAAQVVSAPYLVGTAVAAVSGFLAVRWMVRLIVRGALTGFVYYLLGLGALVIALQVSGKL